MKNKNRKIIIILAGCKKIRNNNRPSPGLDFNNFQYKAIGYKTPFGQSTENEEQDDLNEDMNNI